MASSQDVKATLAYNKSMFARQKGHWEGSPPGQSVVRTQWPKYSHQHPENTYTSGHLHDLLS